MPDMYGLTPQGLVIKRLDTILDELNDDISAGWGVNTRHNTQSLLNVLITSFGDKAAELWEVAQDVYDSMYPFSAEDISLDNAVQFGGIAREGARPTFYQVHVEAEDGTVIPNGSIIRTDTTPETELRASGDTLITRNAFNNVRVRVAALQGEAIYTVSLNGALYSYTSKSTDTTLNVIQGLYDAVTDDNFDTSIIEPENDGDAPLLSFESKDVQRIHELVLSGNLTTESVTALVSYHTAEPGNIVLPNGTITQVVTSVPGLMNVINKLPSIAGRLVETDIELRQSYTDKIFARSNRMIESIRSAILTNVQGVDAIAGYQNDTSEIDEHGRWPHCVEMVVDGGSELEIALQIWDKKTDGIQTFGDVEVEIPGDEGEPITMRFNRPEYVYIWFRITVTRDPSQQLPPNYVEAIQNIVNDAMSGIQPGRTVVPQMLVDKMIYAAVPGIAFIETATFNTTDPTEQPGTHTTGAVPITPRQRAVTELTRIEVILSG